MKKKYVETKQSIKYIECKNRIGEIQVYAYFRQYFQKTVMKS